MNLEQLVSINLFQFFLVFARLGSAITISGAPSFNVTMTASRPTSRRTASSMQLTALY